MLNVVISKGGENHVGFTTVANEEAPTFFDSIRERLSVRSYDPEIKISREELNERLRQAARWLLQPLTCRRGGFSLSTKISLLKNIRRMKL